MDLGLKGKTALVTGASRGLGYGTAKLLATEGANVAINSRSVQKLDAAVNQISTETGQPVVGFPGDLVDHSVAEKIIAGTIEKFGSLDILITNAGGPPAGGFLDIDESAWQKGLELTFLSNVRLIRAALPYLKQSQTAAILTITSYAVKQPIPNLVLSNSIRAATAGLTKSLAQEFGPAGIRVNSILPGWTSTERVDELLQGRAQRSNSTIEAEAKKITADIPLQRMADPEEFARAAVFLVSPAASYITGVLLNVDGGIHKGLF